MLFDIPVGRCKVLLRGVLYRHEDKRRGNDDIGRLMEDFMQKDPSKMHYEVLKHRVQSVKTPLVEDVKEGNMSEEVRAVLSKYGDAWEANGMKKGLQQGMQQTARAMLARNMDKDLIADCTGLTPNEVNALAASAQ